MLRRLVAGELPWPLLVLGPAGTGKTSAALVLADHAGGFFYTASDLALEFIRAQQGRLFTREKRPVSEEALWSELSAAALVVLDDVGSASKVSDHEYRCVKKLLDLREGLPLFATSNLDLNRLGEVYDDRVASRLQAGTVLTLSGRDRRLPTRQGTQETRSDGKTARRTL